MSSQSEERCDQPSRCPLCSGTSAAEPAFETHCPECGYLLWFRKRTAEDVMILDVVADRIV